MTSPATTDITTSKKKKPRHISFETLVEAIQDTCAWSIGGLDGDDAEALADQVIDLVIAALRRELPKRSLDDWTLALAGLRHQVADLLAREFERNTTDGDDLAETIIAEIVNSNEEV